MKKKVIYLDHAATTPVDPEVFSAMEPWFTEGYGNPSAKYLSGFDARRAIDDARDVLAEILSCSGQEIIFTAGGTESVNLAVLGVARKKGEGNIVVTAIEHSAVLESARQLGKEGFDIREVPVGVSGIVDIADILAVIDEKTILVSVMLANNEIGTIQPVADIVTAVKEKNATVLVHTDACQATGELSLSVKDLGVDLLTLNASKIYGPKGVGALYVRSGVSLQPLQFGGDQEQRLRPGTENTPGIVGFAKAVQLAVDRRSEIKNIRILRNRLIDGLLQKIPDANINGDREVRLANNANIFIPEIDGEVLLLHLDAAGIEVSLGSACAAGSLDPSHVLLAIGLNKENARRSLRFTLGRSTTEEDIDQTIEILDTIVRKVRI